MRKGLCIIAAIAITLLAAILIAGCKPQAEPPSQPPSPPQATAECSSNSDCGVGGCSGQVCTAASKASGLITTCEYKAEYDCFKLTSCGCESGKCQWAETPAYEKCVEESKGKEAVY